MSGPSSQPVQPPRNAADMTVSIIAMVITVLAGAGGALMGVFSLAFLDNCPPESCSVDGAITAVMTGVGVAALLGVIGVVLTIVRLVARRRAWPFALAGLAGCIGALALGAMAYTAAVS